MPRSALVIVVDRLGAGLLGPYGNTWLETPELNRLAAESTLWEWAFADAVSLEEIYRGYWTALSSVGGAARLGATGLASELARANIPSELITDAPEVADHPLAAGFDDKLVLFEDSEEEPGDEPEQGGAAEIGETHFARLLAAAIERLEDPTPRLVWLHARGLAGPWDAPYALREQFRDEDDPASPVEFGPPEFAASPNCDPDLLLGWVHAAAGQVAAFDPCLGALLDAFRASPLQDDSLVVFTSPRGYPLGEHGEVGPAGDSPYEEFLHVPLLVRRGDGAGALARAQSLAAPADLGATLRHWFDLPALDVRGAGASLLDESPRGSPGDRRPIVIGAGDLRAVRTSAWFLRQRGEQVELFVKPDDRWEVNEVSRRCPAIVESLVQMADEAPRLAGLPASADVPAADEALWSAVE